MHSNCASRLSRLIVVTVVMLTSLFSIAPVRAQDAKNDSAFLNPALPTEKRVEDLISRMTLEEKASQLVNQARAIPRLNVPAYDWWSESLHGVMVDGTTEFPEPVGLAATFDTPGNSRNGRCHRH